MYAPASTSASIDSPSLTLIVPDTSGSPGPDSSADGSSGDDRSPSSDFSSERRYSAERNMYPVICIEYTAADGRA